MNRIYLNLCGFLRQFSPPRGDEPRSESSGQYLVPIFPTGGDEPGTAERAKCRFVNFSPPGLGDNPVEDCGMLPPGLVDLIFPQTGGWGD